MSRGLALASAGACCALAGAWVCILVYPHDWLRVEVNIAEKSAFTFDVGLYKVAVSNSRQGEKITRTPLVDKRLVDNAKVWEGLTQKRTIYEVKGRVCQSNVGDTCSQWQTLLYTSWAVLALTGLLVLLLLSSAALTVVHWWGTSLGARRARALGVLLQMVAFALAVAGVAQYAYLNRAFGDWSPQGNRVFPFSWAYFVACIIALLTTSPCILNVMAGPNPKGSCDDEDDGFFLGGNSLGSGLAYGAAPPGYGATTAGYGAKPVDYGAVAQPAAADSTISANDAAHGALPTSFGGRPPSFTGPATAALGNSNGQPMPVQGYPQAPLPPGSAAFGYAEQVTYGEPMHSPVATTSAAIPAQSYGTPPPVQSPSAWEPEKSLPEFREPM